MEGEPDPNPDIRNAEEEENKRIQPANEFYDGETDNDRDAIGANLDDLSVGASSKNIPGAAVVSSSASTSLTAGQQLQPVAGTVGASSSSAEALAAAEAASTSLTHAVGGAQGGSTDAGVVNASADSSNNETADDQQQSLPPL